MSVLCRPRSLHLRPSWASQVQWFELSGGAGDRTTLQEAVSSASVIYNFAGSSGATASNRDPIQSLDDNCRTQLDFLAACERAGHCPHVVFPSSWPVYGVTGAGPIGEDQPVAPRSIYAAHKLCIEHYLQIFQRRQQITYTIARISNPYGFDRYPAGGVYKILNWFVQRALANMPITIFGDGEQLRDFVYIADAIDALMLCGFSARARNAVFNIGSGTSHSMLEAARLVQELAGATVRFQAWPDEYQVVESGDYTADISKARTETGFRPRFTLRSGLEETIRQYRADQVQPQAAAIAVSCLAVQGEQP